MNIFSTNFSTIREGLFLIDFWKRLKIVKKFTLRAGTLSKDNKRWNGKGDILVNSNGDVLIVRESGRWHQNTAFRNIFRWTLDLGAKRISLEHLRFGPNYPVFLFHLAPISPYSLASIDSYLCKKDVYSAKVFWSQQNISLIWHIFGPNKNEYMIHEWV